MQVLLGIFLGYVASIGGLIILIGAGIIFFRTKSIPTAMFFFGLFFSALIGPPVYLFQRLGIHFPIQPLSLVAVLISIIQAIGLLLYALSLPKK